MIRPRTTTALLALAAVAALLPSCGDDGGGGSTDTIPVGAVEVEARDISFDAEEYSATAGDVTIAYVGEGQLLHTLVVEDPEGQPIGDKLEVRRNDVDTGTYPLPAGSYTIYCDIPGHRQAGMEATLTAG